MFLASLRLRLALLVGLGLLPALGILIWFAGQHRDLLDASVRNEAVRTAQLVAELNDRSIGQAHGILDGLAQVPDLVDAPPEVCAAILARIRTDKGDFLNLGVAGPDGQQRCSAVPSSTPVSIADRDYFREALARDGFSLGAYQIGRITGRPSINVARPIHGGDGVVVAVVWAALDLEALGHLAGTATLAPGSFLAVTDRSGTILARHPADAGWVGTSMAQHIAQDMGALAEEDVARDAVVDGTVYLLAHSALGEAGQALAHVYVGIPRQNAFAGVDRMLQRVFVGIFGTTLLVLALVWIAGDLLLVRRMEALVSAAERVGAGDLSARAGLAHGPDEFGRLASAFDQMAANVDRLTALHRQMIEGAGEGICSLTPNGRISSANPAAARLVGLRMDQLVGATAHTLFHGHEDTTHADAECPLRMPARDGAERRGTDDWFQRDGAPRFPVSWVATPLRDDGRLVGAALVFHDESERLRLTDKLRQAAKMEAVGQLAGGVAHDFNNLLTAILGYSDLLKVHLHPEDRAWRDAEEIIKAARRAAALTGQLLSFSRRREPVIRVLELDAVVGGMDRMLRRLIGEQIEVAVDLGGDAGSVRADSGELEQVLLNLAVNAREAMPTGGRLTISTGQGVPPGGDPSVRWAMMAVADTGVGMSAEVHSRIFEPFYTTKDNGTGLGLATVLRIVRDAGGQLTCESTPGEGTTFRVFLPQAGDTAPALPGAANEPLLVGSETILVVEDEQTVRALARRTLEMCGYTVIEALDVHDAVARSREYNGPIDLLLTDMVMPGMNGIALAAQVRSARAGIRVLYMSGYDDDRSATPLPDDARWLAKPFSPPQLARIVREMLDRAGSVGASPPG